MRNRTLIAVSHIFHPSRNAKPGNMFTVGFPVSRSLSLESGNGKAGNDAHRKPLATRPCHLDELGPIRRTVGSPCLAFARPHAWRVTPCGAAG